MRLRKVIQRHLRRDLDGVAVAGGLHAVVSANVGEPGTTATSSKSRITIVQGDGRTERFETEVDSVTKEEDT